MINVLGHCEQCGKPNRFLIGLYPWWQTGLHTPAPQEVGGMCDCDLARIERQAAADRALLAKTLTTINFDDDGAIYD